MNKLTATSVSIGIVGAIMSWIYLGVLGAAVAIPVSFIAWGAFAAAGGNNKAVAGIIKTNRNPVMFFKFITSNLSLQSKLMEHS